MKIFQCANNACSGGAPMVFPQSALSVQDILNAGGKSSGNAPIRATSLQQFLLWMSSVRFQFLPERFQPLSTNWLMLYKRFFRGRIQFLCCTAKLFSRYFSAQQLC